MYYRVRGHSCDGSPVFAMFHDGTYSEEREDSSDSPEPYVSLQEARSIAGLLRANGCTNVKVMTVRVWSKPV